jgi:hypothetical protein
MQIAVVVDAAQRHSELITDLAPIDAAAQTGCDGIGGTPAGWFRGAVRTHK